MYLLEAESLEDCFIIHLVLQLEVDYDINGIVNIRLTPALHRGQKGLTISDLTNSLSGHYTYPAWLDPFGIAGFDPHDPHQLLIGDYQFQGIL